MDGRLRGRDENAQDLAEQVFGQISAHAAPATDMCEARRGVGVERVVLVHDGSRHGMAPQKIDGQAMAFNLPPRPPPTTHCGTSIRTQGQAVVCSSQPFRGERAEARASGAMALFRTLTDRSRGIVLIGDALCGADFATALSARFGA